MILSELGNETTEVIQITFY